MRLSFLAFYATVVSVAEGSALRGLIDEIEGENNLDAESRTGVDSAPEDQRKKRDAEDVDSRPFLHERPRKADLSLFSRVLQSLDYRTSVSEYGLCEGDCDNDDDCDKGLKCFQRRVYVRFLAYGSDVYAYSLLLWDHIARLPFQIDTHCTCLFCCACLSNVPSTPFTLTVLGTRVSPVAMEMAERM